MLLEIIGALIAAALIVLAIAVLIAARWLSKAIYSRNEERNALIRCLELTQRMRQEQSWNETGHHAIAWTAMHTVRRMLHASLRAGRQLPPIPAEVVAYIEPPSLSDPTAMYRYLNFWVPDGTELHTRWDQQRIMLHWTIRVFEHLHSISLPREMVAKLFAMAEEARPEQ